MARRSFNALDIINRALREHIKEGDICIDATMGRGNDTLMLCTLVGDSGSVIAFDIQQEALDSTAELLRAHGMEGRARLLLKSHSEMGEYFAPESVSCITFNFGWLPKGDHHVFTRPDTSIAAIEAGLELLKPGGMMTMIIYYGRESGFEERDALLAYLPAVDSEKYTVLELPFVNRPNCPPIPVIILKD